MKTGYKEEACPSNPSFVQTSEFFLFHLSCMKIRKIHPPDPHNVLEGEALPCTRSPCQPVHHSYTDLFVQSVMGAHQKLCSQVVLC